MGDRVDEGALSRNEVFGENDNREYVHQQLSAIQYISIFITRMSTNACCVGYRECRVEKCLVCCKKEYDRLCV